MRAVRLIQSFLHLRSRASSNTLARIQYKDEKNWQDFILHAEDKWLQYADYDAKVRAFFGTETQALRAYRWYMKYGR